MLDETTLDRFARSLRGAGAQSVDHLNPGLTDRQIDELTAAHGLALPEEARRLWRWHDGGSPAAPPGAKEIAPGRRFVPLDSVLAEYAQAAADFRHLYGFDHIIEPFTAKPMIFFDCRGSTDAPAPVLVSHEFEEPKLALPSIGDLIAVWTQFIDDGVWTITEGGQWDGSYVEALSDDILERGIF
jgi:hypothetical protein